MYLVEYVKILKNQNKKCCTCFYSKEEAINFFIKLADCTNIKSAELSSTEFTKKEILYTKEKYFY